MSKPRPAVPPHPFQADPEVPPDHLGRRACRRCNLISRPGDAHHTMPDAPEQADVLRRYEPGGQG